ncbi:MAG TPA: ribonuclease P protein component [Opitutaceae bacterium]|nr:ribonuclease P protein component [Opitutaceae bacterium]
MRFRPEQHLRRQSEIRGMREHGRRLDCRAFTLWWQERAPDTPGAAKPAVTSNVPRVCVVASGAAVGGAVLRNRAKRRLREIFRTHQAALPPRCDVLLVARVATTQWPMAELEKKFTDACRQITPAAHLGKP